MKKILLLLLLFFIFPIKGFAQTYEINDNALSIQLDDSSWYVFTRENLANNKELEELGITYDYLFSFMQNNKVYMDSLLIEQGSNETIEIFIRINAINDIDNLSQYSNNEIEQLAEVLANRSGAEIYSIYENNYKYINLQYYSSGYHLIEYYTVMNREAYTLTIQKKAEFTANEINEIKAIVNSVVFLKSNNTFVDSNSKSSGFGTKFLIGAITGGFFGLLALIAEISQKKKKKKIRNGE